MISRSRLFVVLFASAVTLLAGALCNCTGIYASSENPASPVLTSADGSTLTVYISGDVVDTDGFLVTADFLAEAINNRTDQHILSDLFGHGRFQIPIIIPIDAVDNDTFMVRVVSLDQTVVYGTTNVTLANTNHTVDYAVEILVLNPPPNYNGVLLIVLVLAFAGILAAYIVFTKWMITRMVLKKVRQTSIREQRRRREGEGGGDI